MITSSLTIESKTKIVYIKNGGILVTKDKLYILSLISFSFFSSISDYNT